MNKREFSEVLQKGAEAVGVALDEAACSCLHRYFLELKQWSSKINLIARETEDALIVEKHFIDSLAVLTLLRENRDHLLDIGTGAGFPGLVCKAARPLLKLTLVESRLKRVSFLRQVVRCCGLADVSVHPVRFEQMVDKVPSAGLLSIVSRAVADVDDLLSLCLPVFRPGCRLICMKGPKYIEELENISAKNADWKLTGRHDYRLPVSRASRVLLVFEPDCQTGSLG